MIHFARRPKAVSLARIYDQGREAFRSGVRRAEGPYRDTAVFGNLIRDGLWQDGWSDEAEHESMELI